MDALTEYNKNEVLQKEGTCMHCLYSIQLQIR